MPHALVFGASGQIGRPLLRRLCRAGWSVTALSRRPQPAQEGVAWLRGEFAALPPLPDTADAVFSCGPLDRFAQWYAAAPVSCPRVVAFGSTSVLVKQASPDPAERDIAARLREGESRVFEAAARRGAAAALLRPTLIYGSGQDATLSRIARLARRWGRFPLPSGAVGLRMPVHADDLADAAFACFGSAAAVGQAYALPGGERLPYREMVSRVLAALDPPAKLVELPAPCFAAALWLARATGRVGGLGDAAVQRMREDLVFDDAPARRDFGYAPRPFHVTAAMLPAD